MLRRNKIISLILFVFLCNTKYVNSQNCTPNTTNSSMRACGIESSKICSTPYIYQYDVSDINQYNINLFWDQFYYGNPSTYNWQPSTTQTTLTLDANRLKIEKTSGGSAVLGAYKTFVAVAGRDYVLFAKVDKGSCNGINNIEINIRDVSNTIVATNVVSSSGISQINFPFTTSLAGNYTVEFKRVGNSSPCAFFINEVQVVYSKCAEGLYLHNWHHFYVSNSSLINMVINDNTSSLAGARLYGPFLDDTFSGVCNNIQSGSILPIDQQLATSGTVNLASNLSTGWYLLDVIDDDCLGCIEITTTEGTVSCSTTPCPTNSTCENIQKLCENTQFTTGCSCVGGGAQLWYEFDITNPSQALNISATNLTTNSGTNFNYAIVGPLEEGYSCETGNLQSHLVQNGSGTSSNLNFNSFPSVGTYVLVIYGVSCGAAIFDVEFNISFSPELACGPIICPTDITIECDASNPNLVINGDFEIGNFAETTTSIESDYSYDSDNSTNPGEGSYKIVQGPWTLTNGSTPVFNHTPSAGLNGFFMEIHDDLNNTNDFAWKRTISSIQSNTQYTFEYWFYLHQDITNNLTHENINLYVNGDLISSIDRSEKTPYEWHKVKGLWNSGNNTTAELKIEVKVNQGVTNDDGRMIFDDISFKEICNKCAESEVHFIVNSTFDLSNITLSWDFGDGTPVSENGNHIYSTPGTYIVTATVTGIEGCNYTTSTNITIKDCIPPPPCEDCIGSFRPIPDQKYIISAWTKEAGAPLTKTSYDKAIIQMHFYSADHTELPQIGEFKASGMIIDGWQRIEEEFFVPAPTAYVAIELVADGVDVFFDDIRVFPFDASMKSYVYDPVNMRLVAELDERHYATFYEYDEEGKLIRIKKETEKGVMTIQETRNSTKKQ